MFFKPVDLSTALRPSLLPDETLLFVQDGVGLYEGKYKLPGYQQGHAYLTSHRACYIDDADPRGHSLAIDLRDVDRPEFQARFLRSSPKVVLYPKLLRNSIGSLQSQTIHPVSPVPTRLLSSSSPVSRSSSPLPFSRTAALPVLATGTWICPICSFSNTVPSNFDAATANSAFPIPPCLACGIKPPFTHVLKAAIAAANRRRSAWQLPSQRAADDSIGFNEASFELDNTPESSVTCPRCTSHNHPSLLSCEVCGADLLSVYSPGSSPYPPQGKREESPGPRLDRPEEAGNITENVKFSFRAGGEKIFYERLKGALIQRKWLLQNAPPIPKPVQPIPEGDKALPIQDPQSQFQPQPTLAGIAGLEQRGAQNRKNKEVVIGSAFEDLEALMASAKEIVALAEQFAAETGRDSGGASSQASAVANKSATALGMVTTRDLLGGGSDSLYLSELSRNLVEYLTDDKKGVLKGEGGIMSLVDLWAVFNRSRNGVELVSPMDFEKAAQLWGKLSLPLRLRRFKSGLLVVQRHDWNDEKTLSQLRSWFESLHHVNPNSDEPYKWQRLSFGHGVTAQEAAQKFGWSIGVAIEELEMAEERGLLSREEGIEGLKFWQNHFLDGGE